MFFIHLYLSYLWFYHLIHEMKEIIMVLAEDTIMDTLNMVSNLDEMSIFSYFLACSILIKYNIGYGGYGGARMTNREIMDRFSVGRGGNYGYYGRGRGRYYDDYYY